MPKPQLPRPSAPSSVAIPLLALLACPAVAPAQDFPSRPVRLVVPFAAGGVSDIIGRVLAARLQDPFGQPVIVDNRGGAGGSIGSDLVARAQPDGHTFLLGSNGTHAIVPHLYRRLPYDPVKDFTPIGMVAITPTVLAVNPEVPARSVKELLALARARPGQLGYGSSGIGSTSHLAGEMLATLGAVSLNHVPYKSASAAYPDVFGGRVPLIFDSVLSMTPYLKAGKLRALAVTTPRRVATMPEVPTMAEAGIAGYSVTLWIATFGPAGMPAAVTARHVKAQQGVLALPEVREQLGAQGAELASGTPAELASAVAADLRRMGELVRAARIEPQ